MTTETTNDLAPARMIAYVDPELCAVLPPLLAQSWVADELLVPFSDFIGAPEHTPAKRAALEYRRQRLLDDASFVLRPEALPDGKLCDRVFVDALGRLEIVGTNATSKIRVDEDLAIVIVRKKKLRLEGARQASLRQELRAAVAIPLGGTDRKPIAARMIKDVSALDPDGIYAEFEPPPGTGFVRGRFGTLHVYSNGKLLLIGFAPIEFEGEEPAAKQRKDAS